MIEETAYIIDQRVIKNKDKKAIIKERIKAVQSLQILHKKMITILMMNLR
jgi:hypothetical protein